MLDRIIDKLIRHDIRLDDDRIKAARFEKNFKAYYSFKFEGVIYEFKAKDFIDAYWACINNNKPVCINEISFEESKGFKEDYYENKSILEEYGIKYLYHMTHYKNLESILKNGLLSHYNNFVIEHIDNAEVNDRRNRREPFYSKSLHTYVPFYFNPKNPMLFVNKDIQDDIIILAFDKDLLLKDKTIFTDGNAATNRTNFYYNLADLNKLNWNCINARYWTDFEDGKREVMAEILVPNKVKIEHLRKIYCYDKVTESFVFDLDHELNVQINTNLYF